MAIRRALVQSSEVTRDSVPASDCTGPSAEAAGGRLTIDLAALRANYRYLAGRAAPARCAAVVKADAYGIGVARAVPALLAEGCRDFFVAQTGEAATVRALLPDEVALYVLNGVDPGGEAALANAGAMPVLNSIGQARRWQAFAEASGRPLPAALQIDSGMSRLGMAPEEARSLFRDGAFRGAVPLALVMSHLACADEVSAAANREQLARFQAATAGLADVPLALANSGGTMLGDGFRFDLVRVGIALYGGAPNHGSANPMRPVIGLEAKVIQLRTIVPGTRVGYGLTYEADAPTRLATLAVGYGDGWPRALGNCGAAAYGGRRLPIVGRVSMDSMTIDVTALDEGTLGEGDWVELIGPDRPIDTVAAEAGTIAYELLTNLGRRYRVCVRDEEQP